MEFHCDRCGTRYSTTQAVRPSQPYTYRCRICAETVVVRAPGPSAVLAGDALARERRDDARQPAGATALDWTGRPVAVTSRAAMPAAPARSEDFSSFVVNPEDLPRPDGGYIDLVLDDPPAPPSAAQGAVSADFATVEVATPVPAPALTSAATATAPAARRSFRPADLPNRSAREVTETTLSRSLRLTLAPAAPAAADPERRPWWRPGRKLTRGQRLATVAAVFTATTALAVAVGIGVASRAPPPVRPVARRGSVIRPVAPPAAAARAQAPAPVRAAPTATAPREGPTATAPAPQRPAPQAFAPAPAAEAPPAPAPPQAAIAAAGRETRPARKGSRTAAAPPRLPSRGKSTSRGVKVARASAAARNPEPAERASSPPPAPSRDGEPVAARPGYRAPSPVEPRCVERHVRVPATFSERLPGSVILRFAVGRDGVADTLQIQPGPDRLPGERIEPELVKALAAAVGACRFSAGTDERGRPVRMWSVMRVQFAR
jgi:hypothetical protein